MQRVIDALLGRYRIERELGKGGMATVFLATDLKHHRPVAIKILNPALQPLIGVERFLREIDIAAALNHPHILPLFDSGEADGLPFYVMPFVEGESLRCRLEREKQLPLADALQMSRQILDALRHAHAHGVVHRDIKPENVLLQDGHATVADFGVALALATAGTQNLTDSGITLGTPAYMSPEQSAGVRDLDGRSDLYSLGCMLYEMLAGVPPFAGPTAQCLAYQHLNVMPRPVSELRPSVPEGVAAALQRVLAKAPADRFQTAVEFAAALTAVDDPRGTPAPLARPAEPTRGPRPSAWRAPRMIASAAGIVLAVVAVVTWQRGWTFSSGLEPGLSSATKKDWVLVADFAGPPDDPSLARAARRLMISAIDQSATAASVPRDQIALGLERAGKPDTLRLTPDLARELAYRSAVWAVLECEVAALGGRYTVALMLTDVDEDRQLLALTQVARSERDLIPTLQRMGRAVQKALDRRPELIRTMRPRDAWPVATSSFEAYRRFAEGITLYDETDFAGALRQTRQAVELDPEFGAAWGALAWCYWQLGLTDSASAAVDEALSHPESISPAYRLYLEGVTAMWRGDVRTAKATYARVIRLYPSAHETGFARNNLAMLLMAEGRTEEALELERAGMVPEAFGLSPLSRGVLVAFLVAVGRYREADSMAAGLRGTERTGIELTLALAEGDWLKADSLVAIRIEQSGPQAVALARAQVAAARGRIGIADDHLRHAEEAAYASNSPIRARYAGLRAFLAVMGGRAAPRLEARLERDTTASALITRAYVASVSGNTALARRLLTALKARPTTHMGTHGTTPEFIEACLAAHAGRWNDVVVLISGPARKGSDQGRRSMSWLPSDDRIGTAPERWLVAQAWEQLGQPDSAAAFYLRMLAPGLPNYSLTGLVHPFVHQRLVMLYARTGRLAEAEEHLAILERDVTMPDPDVARLLEEARAAVRGARGLASREAGRR